MSVSHVALAIIGRFASPKTVLVIVQVGYCGWPPVVQGSTPRISHLINLDQHLWVHDKGTSRKFRYRRTPAAARPPTISCPTASFGAAPWPGCLSRSSLRYQWVVARLPASSPGISDDFDSGAVADVYE